jgi:hypothetical protein
LTRKNQADIFHLDLLRRSSDDCLAKLDSSEIQIGHLVIKEHTTPMLRASFSSDGSLVVMAGSDGFLNFIQVLFDDDNDDHETIPIARCVNQ